MIEITDIVDDFAHQIGLWCPATDDATDLARMADFAVSNGVGVISVAASAVGTVWPWLEGKNIKIIPRFYIKAGRTIRDADMSEMAVNINAAFKRGASGAIVFVDVARLGALVDMVHVVRDDLFFNKELAIGLNLNEIDVDDWDMVFDAVSRVRADSLVLALTQDAGEKSDFVGRVYSMLGAVPVASSFDICWVVGANPMRLEQVMRLTAAVQPSLTTRTRLMICE
ncbi:MAG: hypothetical protein NC311_03275 [Muribaculaceae bacterium]|nr:hypothetical protein [Muribaculaceae bacterium]